MNFEPLFTAPLVVQVHAFGAMAGIVLGAIQIVAPKGTLPHKALGMVWILVMATVGVSSAFIVEPTNPGDPFLARFTPIHLFTILTAVALIHGGLMLLRGGPAMRFHSRPFIGLYIGGLIIAGGLAFLPGRIMHKVAFGG